VGRNRISSTITEHMVMALRHDLARSGWATSRPIPKWSLERYGFSPAQRRAPALVIPLHDVFGEIAGYQIRPDDPRVLNGRTMKYESRLGQKMASMCRRGCIRISLRSARPNGAHTTNVWPS
jgi:hypothetical protein